jgi:hypothetical protein
MLTAKNASKAAAAIPAVAKALVPAAAKSAPVAVKASDANAPVPTRIIAADVVEDETNAKPKGGDSIKYTKKHNKLSYKHKNTKKHNKPKKTKTHKKTIRKDKKTKYKKADT